MAKNPNMAFRQLMGEADYEIMRSILIASSNADQIIENPTLDTIRNWCAPSSRFDPQNDILFASVNGPGSENTVVGFNRVGWYTGKDGTRLYFQVSFLVPEYRDPGVWQGMVRESERRLQEIACNHPHTPKSFFQAWAAETQNEWIHVLESEGYQAVRHFNNMLRTLDNIPIQKIPNGLEVRPVQEEHYRKIWDAQKEVQKELFEFVAEKWTDDNYNAWEKNPSHTPELWQVAWDGDQVVGMVLTRINEAEKKKPGRKRGHTEHIFVRRPWRQRGLAGALISRSLQTLKLHGMDEAELGVDTENESGAHGFYKRMGYQTMSTDIWYRKSMPIKSAEEA